jgi:hypothetical protein
MRNLHQKILEVGHPPLCQRKGQVMGIFGCSKKIVERHEDVEFEITYVC